MNILKYITAFAVTALLSSHIMAETLIDFSTAEAFAIDSNTVQINNIRVTVEVPAPFGGRGQIVTVYYDVPFEFDPVTLHLVPNAAGINTANNPDADCANLQVIVNNAVDGTVITNATVSIGDQSNVTNAEGLASFTGLPSGSREISVASNDFTGISRAVELTCGDNSTTAFNLNPTVGIQAMTANDVRIVLNWGEHPVDLDAHLTGPEPGAVASGGNEADRFHIFWWNTATSDGVAVLDVDDTTSYGPETVTVTPPSGSSHLRPGLYRYTVYQYEGMSTLLNNTSVDLYVGNEPVRQFHPQGASGAASLVDGAQGNLWTAFEFEVDSTGVISVFPVNILSFDNNIDSGGVTRRSAGSNQEPVDILYAD